MLDWITDFTYKIEDRAAGAGLVYRLARGYYREVIEKEAVLADITAEDNILCIGGGICPFSAILFHEMTGAKVTVIDNNAACIPKAAEVIRRLGLAGKVAVRQGDGSDIAFEEFSVIHLALQVSPISAVFSRLAEQAAPGTKLLVRRPKKPLDGMYGKDGAGCDKWLGCPYTTHKSRNIGATLLYTKSA